MSEESLRAATAVAVEESQTLVLSKSIYDEVLRARQELQLQEKVHATRNPACTLLFCTAIVEILKSFLISKSCQHQTEKTNTSDFCADEALEYLRLAEKTSTGRSSCTCTYHHSCICTYRGCTLQSRHQLHWPCAITIGQGVSVETLCSTRSQHKTDAGVSH